MFLGILSGEPRKKELSSQSSGQSVDSDFRPHFSMIVRIVRQVQFGETGRETSEDRLSPDLGLVVVDPEVGASVKAAVADFMGEPDHATGAEHSLRFHPQWPSHRAATGRPPLRRRAGPADGTGPRGCPRAVSVADAVSRTNQGADRHRVGAPPARHVTGSSDSFTLTSWNLRNPP